MIQQAVILGGFGYRLSAVSLLRPKPLVEVATKPFLLHLLEQLRTAGFSEVLILTGYLGHQIEKIITQRTIDGLRVHCRQTPSAYSTGERLREAENYLENKFMLLYGDNFVPVNLRQVIEAYDSGMALQFLCFKNRNNYSKPNIQIDTRGMVTKYDPTRNLDKDEYVELGYLIVNKKLINLI